MRRTCRQAQVLVGHGEITIGVTGFHRCDGAAKRAGGSMQAVAVGIGACPGRVQQQCVDRSQAADDARRRPGSVATRRVACCVCG